MGKLFLLILWLPLGATLAAAQDSDKSSASLIGIPLVVESKSAGIRFRALIGGAAVQVERIDAPETSPLRIVVIDLRENGANGRVAGELPPELRSLNLRKLRARAGLIRIGQPPSEESRSPADWKLYARPDFEAALRQADTLFTAGDENERQSLLVINRSLTHTENSDAAAARLMSAVSPAAAGRLITVLPDASAGEGDESVEKILKAQIKKWRDALSSFYVLRVAARAVSSPPLSGGRIDAEATRGNKIVGRGSIRVNSAPPGSRDEVETAFADHRRLVNFETLEKYPGLPKTELEFFKAHYDPPIEGVVVDPDPARNERLKRLSDPVFRLHAVENQCVVVLLNSRVPTVFTWKLTFVSLTAKDLEILSDDEITALVAHEVGHLYFADELLKARTAGDDRSARVTELKCDLIALETLHRLKIHVENLPRAVEKLMEARSAMNLKNSEVGSPSLEDRRRIAQKYIEYRKR